MCEKSERLAVLDAELNIDNSGNELLETDAEEQDCKKVKISTLKVLDIS